MLVSLIEYLVSSVMPASSTNSIRAQEYFSRRQGSGVLKSFLPYSRNLHFVGRKAELTLLRETFNQFGDHQRRAALFGLGGVGKSQLAIEFAYRYRSEHPSDAILWIHAGSEERFRQSFVDVARECSIPNADKTDALKLTVAWLKSHESPPWLMIVDNADDADLFFQQSSRLAQHIPECAHGAIIVTTRNKKVAEKFTRYHNAIPVKEMSVTESADLVQSCLNEVRRDNDKMSDINTLSSHLGCLPLALAQAAAYIQENSITLGHYIAMYEASTESAGDLLNVEFEALGRASGDPDIPNAVASTMMLSLDHIERKNPRAAEILSLMAFFDRHTIPESLLLLPHESSTSRTFVEAIGELRAFSLIAKTANATAFEMHRLVHLVTYRWLTRRESLDQAAAKALDKLCVRFPQSPKKRDRTSLDVYLPHALHYLDDHLRSGRSVTRIQLTLTTSVAEHLHYQGRDIEAQRFRVAALNLAEQLFEPGAYEILRANFGLAETLKELREYKLAEYQCLEVIRISEATGRVNHAYINTLSLLSRLYVEQHKFDEAAQFNQMAKETSISYLGEANESTIMIDFQKATILRSQGELLEAEKLLRSTITELTILSGPDSPSTLLGMQHLTNILDEKGCLEESEKVSLAIVEMKKRTLGKDHVETLQVTRNLALCYIQQSRFKEAEKLLLDLLEQSKTTLGDTHPDTLRIMQSLARICYETNRIKEAEKLQVDVLPRISVVLGDDHPETVKHMIDLARTYTRLGHLEEAAELYVDVLDSRQRILGDKHLDTLTIKTLLANTYFSRGTLVTLDKAEALEKEVLATRRKVCGNTHPDTLAAMYDLGLTYEKKRPFPAESVDLMKECVEASEKSLGYIHPDTRLRQDLLTRLESSQSSNLNTPKSLQSDMFPRPERLITHQTPQFTVPNHSLPSSASSRFRRAPPSIDCTAAVVQRGFVPQPRPVQPRPDV